MIAKVLVLAGDEVAGAPWRHTALKRFSVAFGA